MLGSNNMAFHWVKAYGADQLAHAAKACAILCLAQNRSGVKIAQGNISEQLQETMQLMYTGSMF